MPGASSTSEARPTREVPVPAAMPMLLSFVAGYVDSYTYLALFGLFAAQVTGSFAFAGIGLRGAVLAVAIVCALAFWALLRERAARDA